MVQPSSSSDSESNEQVKTAGVIDLAKTWDTQKRGRHFSCSDEEVYEKVSSPVWQGAKAEITLT